MLNNPEEKKKMFNINPQLLKNLILKELREDQEFRKQLQEVLEIEK